MNPHLSTPSNHLKQIHPSQIKPYSFHLYSTHLNSIPSHPIRTQIANPSESLTHFPPTTHFQAPATTPAGPASQLALAALGGYCLPSNSTFGSHYYRIKSGQRLTSQIPLPIFSQRGELPGRRREREGRKGTESKTYSASLLSGNVVHD